MESKHNFTAGLSGLRLATGLLLCLVALLVYAPSFKVPFLFDDRLAVVQNNYIRIDHLGSRALFKAAFQDFRQNRPLTNLSLALNYYFNRENPRGYHIVNFAFFLLTAFGIWLVLGRIFAHLGYEPRRGGLAAWLSALVWTVHPLNTQAVTYIVQRHASMAGAFSVWSIYFLHLGLGKKVGHRTFLGLSALCCLLALLSKETALTLPAVLLAYKLYFFDGLNPGWFSRNWKWLLAIAIFYIAAMVFALRPSMLAVLAVDFKKFAFTPWQRFLTEPRVLVWYLGIIVFPLPQFLSVEHDFTPSTSFFNPFSTAAGFLILGLVLVLTISQARTRKLFSFLALWFFSQVLVEALPLPIDLAFEHRLYLASLSIIAPAVSWPILRLGKFRPALVGMIVMAVFFAVFSFQRNRVWLGGESLWRDAVRKAPGRDRPWYNYCTALGEAGKCRTAIPVCQKAVSLNPAYYKPHHNLGLCYFKTGNSALAEKELLNAASLCPPGECAATYFNLALFYSVLKDHAQAVRWYLADLAVEPENAKAHYFLALNYRMLGDEADCLIELKKALAIDPSLVDARLELAGALARTGQCPKAVQLLRTAPLTDQRFSEILNYCQKR